MFTEFNVVFIIIILDYVNIFWGEKKNIDDSIGVDCIEPGRGIFKSCFFISGKYFFISVITNNG